jgi:hypothetical protein
VRTRAGVVQQHDETFLDLGRDHPFPPLRLLVGLVPRQTDHVDQQMLGEPVPAHQADRHRAPVVGEPQGPTLGGDEPVGDKPLHLLGDRRPADAHPPRDLRLHHREALLLDLVERLEVVG